VRLFGRVFGRGRPAAVPLVDDGTLRLVGSGLDPVRGDSAVLDDVARAGHDLTEPVLVRQLFTLHDLADRPALVAALAENGYDVDQVVRAAGGAGDPRDSEAGDRADGSCAEQLVGRKTQVLTVLSASQARARLTGLETRLAVHYLGWEALAPPPAARPA